MTEKFDLEVIGAGSGGVRAARVAASLGARVAIIECRFFGGTCVHVGCVPKKMFAYASEFPQLAGLAGDYGFSIEAGPVDWQTLRSNKDREIARLNGIYEKLLNSAGVTVYTGYGQIVAANQVRVGDQVLDAAHILIATGGRPWLPEFPGNEHALISDDLFSLSVLPSTAVVVGGGYIAREFASILNGVGVEVTQLYRGDLFLRGFDQDIRQHVASQMRQHGVQLRFQTEVQSISVEGAMRRVQLSDGETLEADQVFYAVGRVPKIDGLFEGVEVKLKPNGAIAVDESYQTSNIPNIHAVGDVIDRVALTPVALAEGQILAQRLFGKGNKEMDYHNIPTAVFCQPEIATVGLTEFEARERYDEVTVYKSQFTPLRHTLSGRIEKTFIKLLVDAKSNKVLGAHMMGEYAAEIIQGVAIAIKAGATKTDFDATLGIHPSVAEEFVTMRTPS